MKIDNQLKIVKFSQFYHSSAGEGPIPHRRSPWWGRDIEKSWLQKLFGISFWIWENRNFCDMAEISATHIFDIVEISVISQKFLCQYIRKKILYMICNNNFPLKCKLKKFSISHVLGPLIPNNRRHDYWYLAVFLWKYDFRAQNPWHMGFGGSQKSQIWPSAREFLSYWDASTLKMTDSARRIRKN